MISRRENVSSEQNNQGGIMKVLVTGGTGFIGSAVVKALRNHDHEATTFDRSLGNDVLDADSCNEALKGKDAVIHLAGVLGTDELFDTVHNAIDVNIHGSVNIMEACIKNDAKYIGITMPPVFPSIYTATKVSSHRFALAYHHSYDLPVTHVEAYNVFGDGQAYGHGHPRKIIPSFSVEGWNNVPLKIWGDGEQTVDLVHVDDVANIFVDALNAPGKNDVIDAGTGEGWTVNQVAKFVLEVTESKSGVEHLPMRRGEIPTKIVAAGKGWYYPNKFVSQIPILSQVQLLKTIVSYRGREVE